MRKRISASDAVLVGNYMILFGGEDVEGEAFARNVDLESRYTRSGRIYVDWEHGHDCIDYDEVIGYIDWDTVKIDERGVYAIRVLDGSNKYVQWIKELIEEGRVGSSTQAVFNEVEKKHNIIRRWGLQRDSLTVCPAEPRMLDTNKVAILDQE